MKELYIATGNPDKLGEIGEICKIIGLELKPVKVKIYEIQDDDVTNVAHEKAKAAFEKVGKPLIVEDVSLYIESLDGFPGTVVKQTLKAIGNQGILKLMEDKTNRNFNLTCAIAYHDGTQIITFPGLIQGTISKEERGTEGWGFDPIVIPEGYTKTLAELGTQVKNEISHRRRAFNLLKNYLDTHK